MIALQIGVLGPHVLNRMCSWQGHLLHSGPGAVLVGRVVKSRDGTVQLLSNRSAVNIWVLGLSCLGLVQASFGRQAAWRLGEQKLWGQRWLHLVWGPCQVVGAQGETLKAWVVKLLGGLSASARAQRTLESPHSLKGPRTVGGAECSSAVSLGVHHLRL